MQRKSSPSSVFALAVWLVCSTPAANPPGDTPLSRSFEMAIPRDEMLALDGRLTVRAAEALGRMSSLAQEHGVRLTVQVPSDAAYAAAHIERIAPMSIIKRVPAQRPFKLVVRVEKRDPQSAPSVPPPLRTKGSRSPHVYIHLRSEAQLEAARRHALRLRELGASISDVEVIAAEGPNRRQLRYFHTQDRAEAASLASGLGRGAVQLLDLSKEYGRAVPPRHYEL